MKTIVRFLLLALAVALLAPSSTAAAPPSLAFTAETADGVTIRGHLHQRGGDALVVYCHSLLRNEEHVDPTRLLDALGPRYDLATFDFRGHSSSFGSSTGGGEEVLDLRAVIAFAHGEGYERIAVLGAGMGATAAARLALIFGSIDALVAVSPSGFAFEISPLAVRMLNSLMLDTAYGKFSVRLLANTRLRRRALSGYPADIVAQIQPPPMLLVQSVGDRQVKLEVLEDLLEQRFPNAELWLVPGRGHAEQLLGDTTLAAVRAFLASALPPPCSHNDGETGSDALFAIAGDCPIPVEIARGELDARVRNGCDGADRRRLLQEVLAFRGYTLASLSAPDSTGTVTVTTPRIRNVELTGNRWVKDDHLRSVLNLGGGYLNAYELDAAVRRLASDPAVHSVRESIERNPGGDVDVRLQVKETFPARFFVSAKFTDIDQFYGAGVSWNEFNPSGLQFEGRALYGRKGGRFLSQTRLGKNTFGGTVFLSVSQFNMVRSRDELEFVFPRQEVHNVGGEVAARYRASDNVALELGAFRQQDREPEGTPVFPVDEGVAAGGVVKLDLAGRLPLQGEPRLEWRHSFYYKNAGLFDAGDFSFETYQWNLVAELPVASHISTRTTVHAGRVTDSAPPQDLLSLGGMHTFPGYEDDAFVNVRMALASFGVYLSARMLVEETSRWAPLRLILSGHAGTVWGQGLEFDADRVASDVMVEVDYRRLARLGVVIPTGGMRGDAEARFFVGWGEHVQW